VLLALAAGVVCAQSRPNVGTNVNYPTVDFYDSIADYFRTSSGAVEKIAQKDKIAAQEIPAVLTIARKSSMSPNQVIDARKQGQTFEQIAKTAGVNLGGSDFIAEANITFLSEYHGRSRNEIRTLRSKGASWVDINEQYRRIGVKPATEKAETP